MIAHRSSRMRGIALVAAAVLCAIRPCAASDTQAWGDLKLRWSRADWLDAFADAGVRLTQQLASVKGFSLGVGAHLRAAPTLALEPAYEFVRRDPFDGVWDVEHRPSARLIWKAPLPGRLALTLSAKAEYRIREDQDETWRLRPRLHLEHAVGPERWNLKAYVYGEMNFETTSERWTRSRCAIGLVKRLGADLDLDLFALRQDDLGTGIDDLNVVGIALRWNLGRIRPLFGRETEAGGDR